MDSIKDYILWTQDLDFTQKPFDDADALVLCALAYLDMGALFAEDAPNTPALRDCLPYVESGEARIKMVVDDCVDMGIYLAAVQSRRFGTLRIRHYVDTVDENKSMQFSAVCFEHNDFCFIAFRGTDNSLVGWKENFMMSCTLTPAQLAAADYLQKTLPDRQKTCYIGGHSKGANLALYAALHMEEGTLYHIARIYLLDGPGICPDVMQLEDNSLLAEKIHRIIPVFSIIGRMYDRSWGTCSIVRSHADFLAQHDLLSWGIEHGKLAAAEQGDSTAVWLSDNLMHWIEGHNLENRSIFIQEFFDALMNEGGSTVQELSAKGIEGLEAIFIKLMGASAVTKIALAQLPEKALFEDHLESIDPQTVHNIVNVCKNPIIQCLALVLLGFTMLFSTEHFIEFVVMAMLLFIALLQSANTFKKLYRSNWNIEQNRERIYISITMFIVCAVLYLKEHALFMIGSLLFGIVCLLLTAFSIMKLKKAKGDHFMYGILVLEILSTALMGIQFLLLPEAALFYHNLAVGRLLVVDGVLRLLYFFILHKAPL